MKEFGFRLSKFEVSVRCASEDIKKTIGRVSLGFKERPRWYVETPKKVSMDREENQGLSPGHSNIKRSGHSNRERKRNKLKRLRSDQGDGGKY